MHLMEDGRVLSLLCEMFRSLTAVRMVGSPTSNASSSLKERSIVVRNGSVSAARFETERWVSGRQMACAQGWRSAACLSRLLKRPPSYKLPDISKVESVAYNTQQYTHHHPYRDPRFANTSTTEYVRNFLTPSKAASVVHITQQHTPSSLSSSPLTNPKSLMRFLIARRVVSAGALHNDAGSFSSSLSHCKNGAS